MDAAHLPFEARPHGSRVFYLCDAGVLLNHSLKRYPHRSLPMALTLQHCQNSHLKVLLSPKTVWLLEEMKFAYFLSLFISLSLASALGPQTPKVRPANVTTHASPTVGQLNGVFFAQWMISKVNSGSKTLALAEGANHVLSGADPAHIYPANLQGVTI